MPPVIDTSPVGVPPPTGLLHVRPRNAVPGHPVAAVPPRTGEVDHLVAIRSSIRYRRVAEPRVNRGSPGILRGPDDAAEVAEGARLVDDVDRRRLRELVDRAHQALGEIAEMQARCPDGVDRFDWSADLLDGLARVALQVGDAAEALTGGQDDELEARSRELATTIVRRRNDALVPLRSARRRMPRAAVPAQLDARAMSRRA